MINKINEDEINLLIKLLSIVKKMIIQKARKLHKRLHKSLNYPDYCT